MFSCFLIWFSLIRYVYKAYRGILVIFLYRIKMVVWYFEHSISVLNSFIITYIVKNIIMFCGFCLNHKIKSYTFTGYNTYLYLGLLLLLRKKVKKNIRLFAPLQNESCENNGPARVFQTLPVPLLKSYFKACSVFSKTGFLKYCS